MPKADHWSVEQLQAEKDRLYYRYGGGKTWTARLELLLLQHTDQEQWALTNAAWIAVEKEIAS